MYFMQLKLYNDHNKISNVLYLLTLLAYNLESVTQVTNDK